MTATAEAVTVAFARACRDEGLPVTTRSTADLVRALDLVDPADPSAVYWAGRALLTASPGDRPAYDRAFLAFWRGRGDETGPVAEEVAELTAVDADPTGNADATDGTDVVRIGRYSPHEHLRDRDFAACSDDERREVERLVDGLRWRLPTRSSRRRRPGGRRGADLDLRRTAARAMRSGGDPFERRFRRPADRPRPVVLLADISGSMEPYARPLLRFLHGAVVAGRDVEAFTIGTRLTRITAELRRRDPDAALARAAAAIDDWSGGTRLGEGIAEFNRRWAAPGLARGAVVVVLSDGWDRGDPELLGSAMARLARLAHRVVWVNPLSATEGYEPLARGMAAALPHVDVFEAGNSVAALEELAEVIAA